MFSSTRSKIVTSVCSVALIGGLAFAQTTPPAQQKVPPMGADHGQPGAMHATVQSDSANKDIIEVATGPGMTEVSTLVAAVQAAGLVDTLKSAGPFTVFAPTNAAFDKLGKDKVAELLKPENKEKLKSILLYHVHAGAAVKAADVKTMSLSTANGKPLAVKADSSGVMINEAKVIKTDVVAKNGIIHWIDTVLVPAEAPAAGGM